MHRPAAPRRGRRFQCALRRRAVASAAAATLLALPGLPAQAQFYAFGGAVSSAPTNLLPIDVNVALQDFLGNTLYVGNGALGSFSALAGAQLSLAELSIASGGGGIGNVVFDGAQVRVGGTGNRLTIGNWGQASLTVQGGALLDATVNANDCLLPGAFCNNFIGHGAGSTTTLAISGAGSEMRTLRYFGLGVAAVHPGMGTPGADSHTTLNLSAGGKLFTDGANVSLGPGGSTPTGTEHSFVDVLIDGAGSRWTVLPDRFNAGSGAYFAAAMHANAQATINISNGGELRVDSSATGTGAAFDLGSNGQATLNIASGGKLWIGGAANPNSSYMNIGLGASGSGVANVSGVGSEITVSGAHARVQVGGMAASGLLGVFNGGRVNSGNLAIGPQGSTGTVNVGGGSILLDGSDGRLMVGDAGNGSLVVSDGGLVDATLSPANCLGNWCGNIVANHAGAVGLLTITGAGSEVRTLRSFETANVYTDQFNGIPGGTSTATINILAGGTLRTQATSLGSGAGGPNALGTEQSISHVTIDGAGSKWVITPNTLDGWDGSLNMSNHALAQSFMDVRNGGQLIIDSSVNGSRDSLTVGNGGLATLNIASGGKVLVGGAVNPAQGHINISQGAGSVGSVTVTGAGSELVLSGHVANLDVGTNGGSGSLSVTNLGRVASGGLNVGALGGSGTMLVDNATVEVNNGFYGRLYVGVDGPGVLTVSNGGRIDATVNPGICIGISCSNGMASYAGTTGTMTITGAGSEVLTLRNFTAASPFVNATRGVAGGDSTANIEILAGGTLRTENATLGAGPSGPNALGTERSYVDVLIAGTALGGTPSAWIVTRNTVDNGGAALMAVGGHANATANVTVSGGGLLRIDGSGGAGPNSGISIGGSGTGTLVITGAGSKLETAGLGAFINVGASNAAGDGSLQLLAGGNATSLFMNVGRNGGQGELVIDGLGSLLTLSGVNTDAGSPGAASANIGRNGGTGSMTIKNGGRFLIADDGMDSRPVNGSPGLTVGREANGTGSLTITGAGSTVEIVTTSLGLPEGTPDNFNPFMAVGRGAETAAGTLMVSNGGKLIMTGNAVSTVANGRSTNLNIGGRNGEVGTGTATVTGAGSEIIVQGYDAYIGVGRTAGSVGTLQVLNQGKVSSTSLLVGADALGTVNLNNGRIALSGHRTDSSAVGAGVTIGRGAGAVGILSLANNSSLTIDADVITGGMSVGGDQFLAGGAGTVTLSGGSSIVMGGPLAGGSILVGRSGTGTMSLSGASLVDVGDTRTFSVATEAGGSGSLSVTGASKVLGNSINIGGASDSVAGGVGTATVSGLGSEIRANGASGFVGIGRSAIGTLSVVNRGKVAAITMSVGRSAGGVGTLSANNGTLEFAGQQTTGNLVGAGLSIGTGGGNGSASIANGSLVTMSNPGTAGAFLTVGGSTIYPLGSGTLTVSGGSQIQLVAAPGLARVRIGHDGSGTATFSGASLLDAGDGNVIIAGEPGSTGILTLNSGSVLNAGYVGVGSKPGGIDGGIGTLVVNASTVNAATLEIGKFSLLAGHQGQINSHIINRGTIGPGNSPGRLIVDGSISVVDQGKIVLDVADDGAGGFKVDELVLVKGTSYDFGTVTVTFNFLGATDPNAFAATGKLDLDTFLRVQDGAVESGLSSDFAGGTTWNGLFAQASFSATSGAFQITNLDLRPDASGSFGISAVPVPEPATWLLWLAGVLAIGARARRRGAARTG